MAVSGKEKRQFRHERNVTNSLRVLEATLGVLDKHNIEYYLDYGTLIGAVREKGFIPWDDDMDISLVHESDYKKIPDVLKDIKKLGFRTYLLSFEYSIRKMVLSAEKDDSIEIHTRDISFTDQENYRVAKVRNNKFWKFGRGGSCLDIFFKYRVDEQFVWMAQAKQHSIPVCKLGNEFVEVDFYHLKCKIPKNYDEYLTSMYGDWKTPKADWQYYEHETCLLEE